VVLMKVLVTGVAGFIGFHSAAFLLERGDEVIGIDNINDYYDTSLKLARLERLQPYHNFRFMRVDFADRAAVKALFETEKFDRVCHLGAQAGVRYSIENPAAYIDSNLVGFGNILEGCRHNDVQHLVYASSSSIYGASTRTPFRVQHSADHPVSLYAATKRANELMAHSYSHLYRLPTTGLRFFTVYGPWGRPDMSPLIFIRKIFTGEPIDVFNNGNHARDFTYIDDIVEGVVRTVDRIAEPDPEWSSDHPDSSLSSAPWRVYNIGNSQPVELLDFIAAIEKAVGRSAIKVMKPKQPGDVDRTCADVSALEAAVGFRPRTPIDVGIRETVDWCGQYYGI
jgi:UDP-glucuronate 4-epimerase